MSGVIVRNLTFVGGKGGVGKTLVSESLAFMLSQQDKKVLWVTISDPTRPRGEIRSIGKNFAQFNCDPEYAFEEYIELKLPFGGLAKLLVKNKWVRTLARASPGVHDVITLGKIWYETRNYDYVIVDLPASGHGMALFQSTFNYHKLFRGGPVQRDAQNVLQALDDSALCSHLVVTLPEELPIQESIEFMGHIENLFPNNPSHLLVNRKFPDISFLGKDIDPNPDKWSSPRARDGLDYLIKKGLVENQNLELFSKKLKWAQIPFINPGLSRQEMILQMADTFKKMAITC